MAKITIVLEDVEDGCSIKTEGLVGPGGTAAEVTAYEVLRLLADLAGADWDKVATPVRQSDGGGAN
jgi:hypothetical protein